MMLGAVGFWLLQLGILQLGLQSLNFVLRQLQFGRLADLCQLVLGNPWDWKGQGLKDTHHLKNITGWKSYLSLIPPFLAAYFVPQRYCRPICGFDSIICSYFSDFTFVAACLAIALALRSLRIVVFFKWYVSGNGVGLNLYFCERRIIGLDWHGWLVKMKRQRNERNEWTIRFLSKGEQYYINRPHVDIPPLRVQHWPWSGWDVKRLAYLLRKKREEAELHEVRRLAGQSEFGVEGLQCEVAGHLEALRKRKEDAKKGERDLRRWKRREKQERRRAGKLAIVPIQKAAAEQKEGEGARSSDEETFATPWQSNSGDDDNF